MSSGTAMSAGTCTVCSAPLPAGAMFCGECGTGVRTGAAPVAAVEPVPDAVETVPAPAPEAEPAPVSEPEPAPVEPEPEPEPAPEPVFAAPEAEPAPAAPEPEPDPVPEPEAAPAPPPGERFVLQFSTGESVTVFGTGLIGRNPRPEPGERFDVSVVVGDAGRSVSKTHLEFGQQDGQFWVLDRYSANGTVLHAPDEPARRCEPGLRIRVPRGSRVLLGEQFFVVS